MGVIHQQMYGSRVGNVSNASFTKRASDNTKQSLMEMSKKLSKKFENKRRRQQCISPCRTSLPGGRPPRHPDSPLSYSTASSSFDKSYTKTQTRTTTIDDYINEKFPADIIAKMEAENNCDVTDASTVLTNETFRMILGTDEEENDGVVLKEIEEEDKPKLWFHFECLDVWR